MIEKITYSLDGKDYSFLQNSDLVNQLFWSLGAALTEIQVFESSIIFLIGGIKSKEEDIDIKATFEKDESKTLGILINELIKSIEDEEFKNILKIIKEDRDYIVHKILRKYGWPVMSDLKYKNAIKEILEIREIIHRSGPLLIEYIKVKKILDLFKVDPIVEKIIQ
jgi:hypothetical protein